MTKEKIIAKLKSMFVGKFGDIEQELKEPVKISEDWQCGSCWLTKIRYNQKTKKFEWYKSYWDYGWQQTQSEINDNAIEIFSDALGIEVKTKTEYFIP